MTIAKVWLDVGRTQASKVMFCPEGFSVDAPPSSAHWLEEASKLAPPSTCPAAAVTPELDAVFLAVESAKLSVVPLGRCHTPR